MCKLNVVNMTNKGAVARKKNGTFQRSRQKKEVNVKKALEMMKDINGK